MKILLFLILSLAVSIIAAFDNDQKITLEKGIVLSVKQISNQRFLPHAYYDQAFASISKRYPAAIFLAKRRYGKLGEIRYSIICYKKNENDRLVVISGTAVLHNHAWMFHTTLPDDVFGDYLLIVLEAIENLPANKALQPSAENNG